MMQRVHPECEKMCAHQLVPDRGGRIVQRSVAHDRTESETILRRKHPDACVQYLGVSAEHPMHMWRVGGRPWKSATDANRTEGKQAVREVKYLHRPAVWTGTGRVDPVSFAREPEQQPEPYPAPSLTSAGPAAATSAPARALLAVARECGWAGEITTARGCMPHATHGRPTAEKFSEAVRLSREGQRAVAVRMGGSWSSLWTWSTAQFFTRHATLEAFKAAISLCPIHGAQVTPGCRMCRRTSHVPVDNPVNVEPSTYGASNACREA